ncbi:MAG: proteasome assembly chaperone family protein [Candidatus Heimdallarchaeota archaeon]|nr:proteasome assembly chaperone family protein [Candidatus Heimdallarchaeota archaeon]MCK4770754.1 proteasome assembly chaperone family protein [Candidatus Heimdallarchaeota archaeon]
MEIINEIKKVNLKNIPVIQSFSGSGAIGTILSTFLISALEMEHVAVIHSESIPPVAIIKDGKIEHPIRLFQSEKLALMSCDIPISYSNTQHFLKMLVDYYIKQGVSHVIPVGGLPVLKDPNNNARCFAITTNDEMLNFLASKSVKILDEGILYGTVVETLELCDSKGFNGCFSLLAECDPGVASYYAAKQILLELSKLFDFEFDEDQFNNVSSTIQRRIDESNRMVREESFDKTRESHL